MSGAVASFYFRIMLRHYAFPSGARLLIFDLCQCRADGSEGNNEAVGDAIKDQREERQDYGVPEVPHPCPLSHR